MVVLFLAQNIEITKFFFIKTALLKNKIIISFVKLVHKSFVSWNKKSSLEYTFKCSFFFSILYYQIGEQSCVCDGARDLELTWSHVWDGPGDFQVTCSIEV